MKSRSFASVWSLLVVWLCALGAGPARHPAAQPLVARSAAELALHDVADAPLLGARSLVVRLAPARDAERDSTSTLSWLAVSRALSARGASRGAREALTRQTAAHADRPRWRVYDAAAPPVPSRTTR